MLLTTEKKLVLIAKTNWFVRAFITGVGGGDDDGRSEDRRRSTDLRTSKSVTHRQPKLFTGIYSMIRRCRSGENKVLETSRWHCSRTACPLALYVSH